MIAPSRLSVGVVALSGGLVLLSAPVAYADDGWVAVARSPSRESLDWALGPDKYTAEANALAQCAEL